MYAHTRAQVKGKGTMLTYLLAEGSRDGLQEAG